MNNLVVSHDDISDELVADVLIRLRPKYITLEGRMLGCRSLAAISSQSNVRDIEVVSISISDQYFRTLCGRAGIEHLSLPACGVSNEYLENLLLSPTIRTLDLRENRVSSECVNKLRADNPLVTIKGP